MVDPNLAKKLSTEHLPPCNKIINEKLPNFQFAPIDKEKLFALLETLNINRAIGSDNISAKVMQS